MKALLFFLLFTTGCFAEPGVIRSGIEHEVENISDLKGILPFLDFEKLEPYRNQISEEALKQPFALNQDLLKQLPKELQEKLTEGLDVTRPILITDESEAKPEVKIETLPTFTLKKPESGPVALLGPDGKPIRNNLEQNPSEIKKSGEVKLDKGLEPDIKPLAWDIVQMRWKKEWQKLSVSERRAVYPLETLPIEEKLNLFKTFLDKSLVPNGGIEKRRYVSLPIKPSAPKRVRELFRRMVLSYDALGAYEFRHFAPREITSDEDIIQEDLELLASFTRSAEYLENPLKAPNRKTRSYHRHYSKQGEDLRPRVDALNLLFILRADEKKKIDSIIGEHAIGVVNFEKANKPFRMVTFFDGTQYFTELEHFEQKAQLVSSREENDAILENLQLTPTAGLSELEFQIHARINPRVIRRIASRSPLATLAFVQGDESNPDAKKRIEEVKELYQPLLKSNHLLTSFSVHLALGKGIPPKIFAKALLDENYFIFNQALAAIRKIDPSDASTFNSLLDEMIKMKTPFDPNLVVFFRSADFEKLKTLYDRLSDNDKIVCLDNLLSNPKAFSLIESALRSDHPKLKKAAEKWLYVWTISLPVQDMLAIFRPFFKETVVPSWLVKTFGQMLRFRSAWQVNDIFAQISEYKDFSQQLIKYLPPFERSVLESNLKMNSGCTAPIKGITAAPPPTQ